MRGSQPVWAIVPASGVGRRMQADRPKQYLTFCDKTIIEHTLDRLLACRAVAGVILVLNENDRFWQALDYQSEKPVHTTIGGSERQDSVINGLLKLQQVEAAQPLVLVHDAVRPLVTEKDLLALIRASGAAVSGAILAIPVADTLKRADSSHDVIETVDRTGLWRALSPQAFSGDLLLKALLNARDKNIMMTDDASAMETEGYQPKLIAGRHDNIKITQPGDLFLAEMIYQRQLNTEG